MSMRVRCWQLRCARHTDTDNTRHRHACVLSPHTIPQCTRHRWLFNVMPHTTYSAVVLLARAIFITHRNRKNTQRKTHIGTTTATTTIAQHVTRNQPQEALTKVECRPCYIFLVSYFAQHYSQHVSVVGRCMHGREQHTTGAKCQHKCGGGAHTDNNTWV